MRIAECNAPVAKNIAEVIENKGLKQIYIAKKAGYSPQEFNDMLNGRRLIKVNDRSDSDSRRRGARKQGRIL